MEAGQEEEPEFWNVSLRLGSECKHLCCNQRVAADHVDVPGRALKAVWGGRERGSIHNGMLRASCKPCLRHGRNAAVFSSVSL